MSLDIAELQNENNRLSQEGGGDFLENFVKLPEGNGFVVMRLLPPAAPGMFGRDKNRFYVSTRVHRVNNKSFHCPKVLENGKWNGDCPICTYYSWLWKESEKKSKGEANAMQAKARAIKPVERYYYNVLVRQQHNEKSGEMEKNVGPKIYSTGKTVHKMIIRAIVGDEALDEKPLGDVTNPKTGRDFKLVKKMVKSGEDNFPNYSDSKFLDPSPLGTPDEVTKWLANLHDLEALRNIKPVEELKHELKVHLGLIQESNNQGGFDPREFQKPEAAAETEVTITEEVTPAKSTTKKAEKVAAPVVEDPVLDESESLADEDFLAELKSM